MEGATWRWFAIQCHSWSLCDVPCPFLPFGQQCLTILYHSYQFFSILDYSWFNMIQVYSIRHFLIFCDIFMRFQNGSNFVHRKILQFLFAALLCGRHGYGTDLGEGVPYRSLRRQCQAGHATMRKTDKKAEAAAFCRDSWWNWWMNQAESYPL